MLDASRPCARRPRIGLLRRANRAGAGVALAVLATVGILLPGPVQSAGAAALTSPPAPAATPPASGAAGDGPTVTIAPSGGGVVHDGNGLSGTLVVENRTDTEQPASHASVAMTKLELGGVEQLDAWASGDGAPAVTQLVDVDVPALHPRESREVPFTIASGLVPLDSTSPFGVHGLVAQWYPDATTTVTGRSTIVWDGGEAPSTLDLTTIVPLVAPLGASTLLDADELATLTAKDGALTRALDAVVDTSATLAIDPRLLVSIRALGTDAPASAIEWLDRLETAPNPSFPLEFADANLTLEAAAGLDAPLEPSGFSFATEGHTLREPVPTTPEQGASATPAPAGSETVAPTDTGAAPAPTGTAAEPTASPTVRPAGTDLADFPWTTPLSWPLAGTVTATGLSTIDAWRPGSVLLSSQQIAAPAPTCAAQVDVNGVNAVLDDADLTAQFETAITAPGSVSSDTALAAAMARLAALVPATGSECTVVATLPRTLVDSDADPAPLIRALAGLGWLRLAPPAEAAPTDSAALVGGAADTDAATHVTELIEAEAQGEQLADLYDHPKATVEQLRAELVRLMSNSWSAPDARWDVARDAFTTDATGALTRINVVSGSDVQLIGHASSIPVFIQNDTGRRVTVEVALRATTGHLDFPQTATVSIEPHSTARAEVPVQAIANGFVHVNVTLATPSGMRLSHPASFNVNVNAGLETVLLSVMLGAVALLFVGGLFRTIRRRRRTIARGRIREELAGPTADERSAAETSTESEAER